MSMTIEAAKQSAKEDLTKTYFANVPEKYEPKFQAVEKAYYGEYPALKKAAATAQGYKVLFDFEKSECKRGLNTKLAELETRVRKVFTEIENAHIKSEVLSEMVDKEIEQFENGAYNKTDSECQKRLKYKNNMVRFWEMIHKVHVLLTDTLPNLQYYGNNLLHVLKEGREMDYRERDFYCRNFSDVHNLSAFTPNAKKQEPQSQETPSPTEPSRSSTPISESSKESPSPKEPQIKERLSKTPSPTEPSESSKKKETWSSVVENGQPAPKPSRPPLVSGKAQALKTKQ